MKLKEFRLTVELVPEKAWGRSLSKLLPKKYWDIIRKLTYRRHRWTCQVCGVFNVRVHCHEVWDYDRRKRLKILVDLMCLCEDCHSVKHWGRTIAEFHSKKITEGEKNRLAQHFCTVNKCTEEDMLDHLVDMGDLNQKRSRFGYKLDLSRIETILSELREVISRRELL